MPMGERNGDIDITRLSLPSEFRRSSYTARSVDGFRFAFAPPLSLLLDRDEVLTRKAHVQP